MLDASQSLTSQYTPDCQESCRQKQERTEERHCGDKVGSQTQADEISNIGRDRHEDVADRADDVPDPLNALAPTPEGAQSAHDLGCRIGP